MGSGRRRGLSIGCIRAGFVGGEEWCWDSFVGGIGVLMINNDYGIDEIDVPRLCFDIDRYIYAC